MCKQIKHVPYDCKIYFLLILRTFQGKDLFGLQIRASSTIYLLVVLIFLCRVTYQCRFTQGNDWHFRFYESTFLSGHVKISSIYMFYTISALEIKTWTCGSAILYISVLFLRMKDSPSASQSFYMLLIHILRKHPILHLFTPRLEPRLCAFVHLFSFDLC